jgi:transposase-like protein
MAKRQYSDNEKASALAFLDFNGGNVQKSAKALGVPHKTLDEWAKGRNQHPEVADLRNEKKEDICDLIDSAVREMIQGSAGKASEANISQLWTSIGIAVDKMQLLKGEATQITKDATPRTNEERANRILALVQPRKVG